MTLPASRQWLLPFHRTILSKLIPDSEDTETRDRLVILAPGLGLRRVVATLLRAYWSRQNLVLLVNASSRDLEGIDQDLGTLACRIIQSRVFTMKLLRSNAQTPIWQAGSLVLRHEF